MKKRSLLIDDDGHVHADRAATEELQRRSGEWCITHGSREHVLLRRPNAPALALAGEVSGDSSLFDAIALIGQGWTGTLRVEGPDGSRRLAFERGAIVDAESSVAGERLDTIVERLRLVSRCDLDRAASAAAMSGELEHQLWLSCSLLDAEAFEQAMALSTRETVRGALSVVSGSFSFVRDAPTKRLHAPLAAMRVLMEAAQAMDELSELDQVLGGDFAVPAPSLAPSVASVPAHLAGLLRACDGYCSVVDVGRRAALLPLETKRGLRALLQVGAVTMKPPRPRGVPTLVAIYNRALAEIVRTCAESLVDAELRSSLVRFVSSTPRLAKLFRDRAPGPDGTLSVVHIARAIATSSSDAPMARLMRALDEYVSFALFVATSLLGQEEAVRLRTTVADRLALLESASDSMVPPSDSLDAQTRAAATPLRSGAYPMLSIEIDGIAVSETDSSPSRDGTDPSQGQ